MAFVASQYEPLFPTVFFQPVRMNINVIRGHYAALMMSCDIFRWSSYVFARVLYAAKQGGEHAYLERFVPLLDQLGRICVVLNGKDNLNSEIGRLSSAIELSLLKNMTSGVRSSYAMLRGAAPVLTRIAFLDPSLRPSYPCPNGISLTSALASPWIEVGRFVMTDIISSLVFGIPPLIKYDTRDSLVAGRSEYGYHMEWLYGCPARFAFSIEQTNRWRADRPSGHPPWREIADDTWAWQARCDHGPELESAGLVGRLAVQEGWRHAVLIYLYMSSSTGSVFSVTNKPTSDNYHFAVDG
ncbi:Fungal Zn(2)-Cys(6) binuclear cluster domain [Ceratobasidium sp. AG-Ba]|nr:Fungal Zn(2)-Cys(6) binuclear cluster domain [Ceratobasidium sp. AG-Ba]